LSGNCRRKRKSVWKKKKDNKKNMAATFLSRFLPSSSTTTSLHSSFSNISLTFWRNYRKTSHSNLRSVKEKGWLYAFNSRRKKPAQTREVSLLRVNTSQVSYSKLHHALRSNNIQLNTKSLERLFVTEPETANALVKAITRSN